MTSADQPDDHEAEAEPGADPTSAQALRWTHEGWDHYRRQSPLAAWACWRRALAVSPGFAAASEALDRLASSPDLPLAARAEYRFLTPVGADQRARWDAVLRSRDLSDLAVAASAFEELTGGTGEAPDGRARFNQGLCLAWLGRNAEATAALGAAVAALAQDEPGVAIDAATLAEVVRHGAGAEALADDLDYVAVIHAAEPGVAEDDPRHPGAFLDDRADVRRIPVPLDPAGDRPTRRNLLVFEWLDRPDEPSSGGPPPTPPRVRATAIRSPGALRLSNPDAAEMSAAIAEATRRAGDRVGSVEQWVSPLKLAFLDAGIWIVRTPPGTDADQRDEIHRRAVETFYESLWIHRPRYGLDNRTPLEAGQRAKEGDAIATAQLAGVIRFREQLGARASTARLYQGYPFDRLRRRVGLPPVDPEAVDAGDPSAMGAADLDALDPKGLDPLALVEAFESAASLGDDDRTGRFAAWLADLDLDAAAPAWRRVDRPALFAVLIRLALKEDDPDLALEWLDRAEAVDRAVGGGRDRAKFATWRAEVQARAGRADAALLTYQQILANDSDPVTALDAAETMLDNGHDEEAQILARFALERAQAAGDETLADRAEALL